MSDPGFTCVQDVYDHLLKRENQVKTDLYVIKWDGIYPFLAEGRLKEMQESRSLAEVTYMEYLRRKRRPKDEPAEDIDG